MAISGILDDNQAEEFKKYLQTIQGQDFEEVVLNLFHVPVMTSAAIGRLILFYREVTMSGRNIRVNGVNENLLKLFRSINLNQLFLIEQ